jgi:O-antigen/teichoic acid export membrane protein
MNRTQRFSRSVLSGYACTLVVAACSLASVYLSLSHLSVPQFGLWALVFQINGYLLLTDFGMSNAVGRFLMDWKDQRPSRDYGETFFTGLLILCLQGFLLFGAALAVGFWAPALLKIPQELIPSFRLLVFGQALISALFFPFRVFSFTLIAYGRFDWINTGAALGQITCLAGFALGMHRGWGLPSYLLGSLMEALSSMSIILIANKRLHLFPKINERIWPRFDCLLKIFRYGKDQFLILFGGRILFASQAIILSRFAGLESVAMWAVGSKMFFFCKDFACQISQAAGPLLIEVYTKGDVRMASTRARDLTLLAGSFATFLGSLLILGNKAFVSCWTKGVIEWETRFDIAFALVLILTCLFTSLIHLNGMTKDLSKLRWVGLQEGLLFLGTAFFMAHFFGIMGMILAHVFAICAISMPFLIFSVREFNRIHHVYIHIAPAILLRWILALSLACFLSYAFCQKLAFLSLFFAGVLSICIFILLLAPLIWGILGPTIKARTHLLPTQLQKFFIAP